MFHKLRVSKTIYASDGYVSLFCQGFCYLAQLKCFLGEPLSAVFRKFPGSENFMDKRAGFQYFQSEIFCLTVSKISYGNPSVLCFRKLAVAKKIMMKWGESRFSPETLLSQSAQNFPRRENFGVPLSLGIEKVSIRKGGGRMKVFCQKIVVSQ